VTECAHSNVHILKDGILYTHPNDEYILRGIAKTRLIQICYHESVPVIERAFTVDELMAADEVIVTSSGDLLVFADEVDGVPVGGKDPDTLGRLRRAVYRDFIDYTGATQLF
jgi:D-alanine transaminase